MSITLSGAAPGGSMLSGGGGITMDGSGNVTATGTFIHSGATTFNADITLAGTNRRVLGDWTTAAIQHSTANTNTILQVLPNGTATGSGMLFRTTSGPDFTNSSFARFTVNSSNAAAQFETGASGTGTQPAMQFATAGSVRMYLGIGGDICFGQNLTTTDVVSASINGMSYSSNYYLRCATNSTAGPVHIARLASVGALVSFYYSPSIGGATVATGQITCTTTTTAYGTTSDRRLKTEITPLEDARVYVDAMNPVLHRWSTDHFTDPDNGLPTAGFIADELQEVFPQAVIGEKDAVDEDGKIIAQNVDLAKIMPLVVSALKAEMADNATARNTITELQSKVAEQEASIATLNQQLEGILSRLAALENA